MNLKNINRLSEIISELSLEVGTAQAGKIASEAQTILIEENLKNCGTIVTVKNVSDYLNESERVK